MAGVQGFWTFTQIRKRIWCRVSNWPNISNEKTKGVAFATPFVFWLGCRDSNPGHVRVRVWCLTAWRHPNIFNIRDYITLTLLCQYLFLTFFQKVFVFFVFFRNFAFFYFTIILFYDTIHRSIQIYPWHSWIARQTPTLKVNGSNPFG